MDVTKVLFQAHTKQSTLLNDVVDHLKKVEDDWNNFSYKAANQFDPEILKQKYEELLAIQDQQIFDLKSTVAGKDAELNDKNNQVVVQNVQMSQMIQELGYKDSQLHNLSQHLSMLKQMQPYIGNETDWNTYGSFGCNGTLRPVLVCSEGSDEEPCHKNGFGTGQSAVNESSSSNEETDNNVIIKGFGKMSHSESSDSNHFPGNDRPIVPCRSSSGISSEEFCSESHLYNWKHQQASIHNLSLLSNSSEEKICCKVKVLNLPREITQRQLNALFGGSGAIDDVVIAQKAKSAIAFITYQKPGSALHAVKAYSGKQFNRKIVVSLDEEDEEEAPSFTFASKVKEDGTWQSESSLDSSSFFNVIPKPRSNRGNKTEPDHPKDRTIYIRNIPYDISEMALQKAFSKFGTTESVDIKRLEKPQQHAYGFIRYKTIAMANFAKNSGTLIVGNAVCNIGSAFK